MNLFTSLLLAAYSQINSCLNATIINIRFPVENVSIDCISETSLSGLKVTGKIF